MSESAETTTVQTGGGEGGGTGGGEGAAAVSAAAAHAGEGGGTGGEGAAAVSAAAAHAGEGGGEGGGAGGTPPAEVADLAKMSDEDYAKAVVPDGEEGETVDRSLITPMAKELREAGIQPSVMAKVGAIYQKVVAAEAARHEAAREERMKELTAKCEAEVTAEEWKDFSAAYAKRIAQDPELKRIVDHTELGSNPAFIRLIALAGAALRVETGAPAAAGAGSVQTNLERAVFERTVPKELR